MKMHRLQYDSNELCKATKQVSVNPWKSLYANSLGKKGSIWCINCVCFTTALPLNATASLTNTHLFNRWRILC